MDADRNRLTDCSKTSCSPREGTRPTRFHPRSTCIVGPVPSPGAFFNGLLTRSQPFTSWVRVPKRNASSFIVACLFDRQVHVRLCFSSFKVDQRRNCRSCR